MSSAVSQSHAHPVHPFSAISPAPSIVLPGPLTVCQDIRLSHLNPARTRAPISRLKCLLVCFKYPLSPISASRFRIHVSYSTYWTSLDWEVFIVQY
ncbi:hypothetical protein B0O99DRAFT_119044 [Bisporella sp. PMI_857]|nr:hypothetical protein B0O99DRAFT_119044 [Bisporella sp. PMI_857]